MTLFRCPTCHNIVDVADPYRFLCPTCGYRNYYPPPGQAPPQLGSMATQPPPLPPYGSPAPPPLILARPKAASSVVSLIFGLVAVCFWWVPVVGAFASLGASSTAIVAGALGIRKYRSDPPHVGGRSLALTGLILGVIGLLLTVYAFLVYQQWLQILEDAARQPRPTA